jgi:hypothetical protein
VLPKRVFAIPYRRQARRRQQLVQPAVEPRIDERTRNCPRGIRRDRALDQNQTFP